MADNQDPSKNQANRLDPLRNPAIREAEAVIKDLKGTFSQINVERGTEKGRSVKGAADLDAKATSAARKASSQINTLSKYPSIEALVTKSVNLNESFTTSAAANKSLMNMPTSALEDMLVQKQMEASKSAQRLKGAVGSAREGFGGFTGKSDLSIQSGLNRLGGDIMDAGVIKAAIIQQKRRGLSSGKQEELYSSLDERTRSIKENRDLRRAIRNVGSFEDESKKLDISQTKFDEAYTKRISTQEKLGAAQKRKAELEQAASEASLDLQNDPENQKKKEATEKAQKALEDFSSSLEIAAENAEKASTGFSEAAKELKKQQAITAAATDKEQAGRGGGWKAAGAVIGGLSGELQYNLVDQKLRAQQARSSIAQYGLKQYDRAFAATQGDVQSMYEVAMSDKTGKFAEMIYGRQTGTKGVREAGKFAENVGNALSAANPLNFDATKIVGSLSNIGGQVTRNVGEDRDYMIEAAEKQMSAIEIQEQYNKVMATLKAKGGQRIHDQFMRAMPAVVGSGSSTLEGKLTDVGSLKNALDKGNLSPSELVDLSTQVNQSVRGSKNDRYDIAVGAGTMEKKGIMSAGQYIQAMSTQAGIGGTKEGLETNLRRAMAAGINDSKLLTEFSELNAGLNQGLADIGIALENNNPFANKVQEFMSKGMSESLASKAAANSIATVGNFLTSAGTGPEAMAQSATIRDTFQKVTGKGPSDVMLHAAMKSDPAMMQKLLSDEGLSAAEQGRLTKGQYEIYQAGRSTDAKGRAQLLKGLTTDAFQSMVNVAGAGARDLYGEVKGFKIDEMNKPLDFSKPAEKEGKGVKLAGQDMKNVTAGAQLKEYEESAKAFGSAAEAFKQMTTIMGGISKQLSTGKTEKDIEKQVGQMKAEQMFGSHVDKFGEWVTALKTGQMPKADPVKTAKASNEIPMHLGRSIQQAKKDYAAGNN